MAINGINAVSKADRGKQYARQGFLASSAADGIHAYIQLHNFSFSSPFAS